MASGINVKVEKQLSINESSLEFVLNVFRVVQPRRMVLTSNLIHVVTPMWIHLTTLLQVRLPFDFALD